MARGAWQWSKINPIGKTVPEYLDLLSQNLDTLIQQSPEYGDVFRRLAIEIVRENLDEFVKGNVLQAAQSYDSRMLEALGSIYYQLIGH